MKLLVFNIGPPYLYIYLYFFIYFLYLSLFFLTPYKSTFCSNVNISLLGIYLKKVKTLIGKNTCTPKFTEASLTNCQDRSNLCVHQQVSE